jgi:hypothetical protein
MENPKGKPLFFCIEYYPVEGLLINEIWNLSFLKNIKTAMIHRVKILSIKKIKESNGNM